jgi:16S rRNA (uracil1498-N3)-methyltransferase
LNEIRESFNRTKGRRGLFAYEGSAAMTLRQALRQSPPEDSQEAWIFVGSEGGFSDQEVQGFRKVGLESLTLGAQVLRVETACIALLAILKYELIKE